MSTVMAVINQKGGVGKTTTTYNIAAARASMDKTVLMIDLDQQASLTIAAGIEPYEKRLEGRGASDLFNKHLDPIDSVFKVTASDKIDSLYIIPANLDLARTEENLITKREKGVGVESLRSAIQSILSGFHFDEIYIDCSPLFSKLSYSALVACDKVIIPCKVDYLSYRGLTALIDTIDDVKEKYNPSIQIQGIIGTMYESNIKDQRTILEVIKKKVHLLGTIRKSADIYRHAAQGLPVVLAQPTSNSAQDYIQIAEKL